MNKNNSMMTRGSNQIEGTVSKHTLVYYGPDSNVYASVGRVSQNEPVYILATSRGWYHIEYGVNGTNQRKHGYIPYSAISKYSGGTPTEEDFYGGYCYASTELDVRTCDNFSLTAPVGTLGKYEGCTFLFSYKLGDKNIAFIEYSTSTGTKRGYVYSQYLIFPHETLVCIANENLTVYSGPSSNHAQLGSVYAGELVSVLAKESNTIYVEYNTIGGRKRGYIDWTKVNPRNYTKGMVFPDFYITTHASVKLSGWVSNRQIVYGGPNTTYANTGAVNLEDVIDFNTEANPIFPLTYIEYYITGTTQKKCGYIDPGSINTGSKMEHNTLSELNNSYAHFGSKIFYGTSQLNRDLFYYKAGSGNKHLFLVFAQHGWEDGKVADGSYYHGDGNMLVRISRNFLESFSSNLEVSNERRNNILKNWTIYVFPYINPDGIINGHTIEGFGRSYYNNIDPNRSWPKNFKPIYNKRNFTGDTPLGAVEMRSLKNVLVNNIGSSKNVLLDIHGWDNEIITADNKLGGFYTSQFGFSQRSPLNDSGYLMGWAKNAPTISSSDVNNQPGLGATTAILEFTPTTDYSVSNIEGNYGKKFFNSTISLLENM